MRFPCRSRLSPTLRLLFLLPVSGVVFTGCSEPAETAAVEGATSLEEIAGLPLDESAVRAAAAVMSEIPPETQPRFAPALHDIPTEGRRGRDLADAYRRQFREALNIAEQTDRWAGDSTLAKSCRRQGISLEEFALTLMQIGCAHHAAEVGGRVDLGDIRARTKTEIASLCDRLDAANDELTRRKLCSSLSSVVALDTYLTLLSRVPDANEKLVERNRERLAALLPPQTAMDIRPAAQVAAGGPSADGPAAHR